jgi:hypothetical protein
MYSGTSSVPKISSGSKSRLKSKKDESRDCNQDQEKEMRRKITLEWSASLVGSCSPWLAVSPCQPWLWGVFPLEKQGEKTWGDGSVCEWICRAPRGLFY